MLADRWSLPPVSAADEQAAFLAFESNHDRPGDMPGREKRGRQPLAERQALLKRDRLKS
jgi:hypothetical protein